MNIATSQGIYVVFPELLKRRKCIFRDKLPLEHVMAKYSRYGYHGTSFESSQDLREVYEVRELFDDISSFRAFCNGCRGGEVVSFQQKFKINDRGGISYVRRRMDGH